MMLRIPLDLARAIACAVLIVAVAACNPQDLAQQRGKKRLSIATGGTGGVYYPYGGGIAKIISENLEGVEATAEVTAASVDNLKFLQRGTSDIAFTMADTAHDALEMRGAFAETGRVPARALAVLYPNYMHVVTLEGNGVRNLADLRGKVVSIGAAGAGTEVMAVRVLGAAGLEPGRDFRSQGLGVAQSVDALKDGKVHAFFWVGGLPTAALLDLVNSPGIEARLLHIDEVLPRLQEQYGSTLYYPATIPSATYGLAGDIRTLAVSNLLVVSESMPETLAYDITRLLFEKQAELANIHPQARELSLQNAIKGSPVPFHPGAVRFYRERSAWKDQG